MSSRVIIQRVKRKRIMALLPGGCSTPSTFNRRNILQQNPTPKKFSQSLIFLPLKFDNKIFLPLKKYSGRVPGRINVHPLRKYWSFLNKNPLWPFHFLKIKVLVYAIWVAKLGKLLESMEILFESKPFQDQSTCPCHLGYTTRKAVSSKDENLPIPQCGIAPSIFSNCLNYEIYQIFYHRSLNWRKGFRGEKMVKAINFWDEWPPSADPSKTNC